MALLRHKTLKIGPEERLFLASFFMRFQGGGTVSLTVRELSDSVGMPPRVVMRAVSRLSSADSYLVVRKVSGGRGRPSRSYAIPPEIRERLNCSEASCPSGCLQAINHLLTPVAGFPSCEVCDEGADKKTGYKQPPIRKKNDQRSLASRWLLAVLISHANEFGVVDGLGMADLRQLTGMTELRLKAQLSRLIDLGVIRSYTPGLSRSLFAGVRVRSSYFLNLSHPWLRLGSAGPCVVVIETAGGERVDEVVSFAGPSVEKFFRRLDSATFDAFVHRLDGYVSRLLSEHWGELDGPLGTELDEHLLRLIGADFQRPKGVDVDGQYMPEERWLSVISHCCYQAHVRARSIRSAFKIKLEGRGGGARFQVIPTSCQGVITLLMNPSPVPQYGCLVLKRFYVCEPYKDETELSVEDRYRFGLQTRPKG